MATRGKEVQDFIKAEKKSARERFIEAGFILVNNYYANITYLRKSEYGKTTIAFDLIDKEYWVKFDETYGYISTDTHKLIHYQLEELGWL